MWVRVTSDMEMETAVPWNEAVIPISSLTRVARSSGKTRTRSRG